MYIIVLFACILIFQHYLLLNVANAGAGGTAIGFLAAYSVIGLLFILWLTLVRKAFIVKSTAFVVIFFCYFTARIFIDFGGSNELFAYLIGTTGGVITFYILGVITSVILDEVLDRFIVSTRKLLVLLLVTGLFFYALYQYVAVYSLLSNNVRTDIFMAVIEGNDYQRPGDFIIISFLITCIVYSYATNSLLYNPTKINKLYVAILVMQLSILMFVGAILGQFITSNKATLLVVMLFLILLVTMLFVSMNRQKINYKVFRLKDILIRVDAVKIILIIVFMAILMVIMIGAALNWVGIDVLTMRITGYGESDGINSSVTSRIKILGTFTEQFNDSPVLGNMKVHTDMGVPFVHSLIGSLLTHMGVVGLLIMVTFLFSSFQSLFKYDSERIPLYYNNSRVILFSLFALLMVFISSAGTFFNWIPLWFTIGLVFSPIKFRKLQKNHI